MNIMFGSENAKKREDQAAFEPYDFSQRDKTCTVAKMKAAWGEPKERIRGMVDLIESEGKRGRDRSRIK